MAERLTLVSEIDLGRHVRDAAYWHKPVGTPISGGWKSVTTPKGVHLAPSTEDRWSMTSAETPEQMADRIKVLATKAASLPEGSTEREHAWGEIAAHVNKISSVAQKEVAVGRRTKKAAPKGVRGTESFSKDSVKEAVTTLLGQRLIGLGVHVVAAAGGLLTGAEMEHFSEALEKFGENRMLEAGAIVLVTILLNGIADRIRKALTRRRDKKIEKARAVLGHQMLRTVDPAPSSSSLPSAVG